MQEDLVYRLKKRAEIRRQISTRKSVQEGKLDRIADLLEEAAAEIERLRRVEARLDYLDECVELLWRVSHADDYYNMPPRP